ncbi:hypothetical protein [Mycoplasmopsis felis]|uniref:hypothetical protein n=1 Tax=Mycoplasmopsis felis TaxID=33923 RepID=UPI002DD425F0|nr:hypothetical protein [Mycoplasmopsis felis]WRX06632.1 hypothetical protein O7984_03925 [Mycoplasmopsis felis]
MKIVNDYKKFQEYKESADKSLFPWIKESVNKVLKEKTPILKKYKILKYSFLGISILWLFISLMIIIFSKNENSLIVSLIFLLLFVLTIGISAIMFYIYNKKKYDVYGLIRSHIDRLSLYQHAFTELDKGIKYVGYVQQDKLEKTINSYKNCEILSAKELDAFKSSKIPYDAYFNRILDEHYLLINDYPAKLYVVEYEKETQNSKGEITRSYHYSGFIKLDTTYLKEKAFEFTLLDGKFSKKKSIETENDNFNKTFNLVSPDPIKARMMYTPLSMELSLKRYYDKEGTKLSGLKIHSSAALIRFTFNIDSNFMELSFPTFLSSEEKLSKHIYKDVLLDTYTLYYILSLIYIPTYLD